LKQERGTTVTTDHPWILRPGSKSRIGVVPTPDSGSIARPHPRDGSPGEISYFPASVIGSRELLVVAAPWRGR